MNKTGVIPNLGAALGLALCGLMAGCSSSTNGPRDLMSEEANTTGAVERPVAMRGDGAFLDGKLVAVATVTRGFDHGRPGGRGGRGEGKRLHGPDSSMGDVYPTGFGDSEEEQKEAMEEYVRQAKARRAQGSPMPPVTLQVFLENHGTEPMEVEVTDVNSDLGNFAVRPPKLTLAPGGKGQLEPMISQLGVTSDEIPLKLAIRVGGKKEEQVVVVKNVILPSVRK